MATLYKTKQGLTLIEILVVVAIIGIIISFGMSIDLNAFRRDTFQAEESTIVALLGKARSRAMSNMFDTAHGVCYIAPNYIVFRGTCVAGIPTNELTPANAAIATASDFSNPAKFPSVVFNRLAGTVTGSTIDITVTDGLKTEHIIINNEGTINW
ncbi:hypothetical protein A3A95_02255 [Candidatus Nomurabacteria bacterium RIFCSPLOWO2_01_FULL_39_18]|uniref:General secretion pathway GspH domain-containing protein n=1 Tax=Candidatus Nomurabacteria bacterium RIFCSPHIGHO2_01_FULL_40_24b TaxID=1801739 RepID=A0A1F6V5R0_9BACT|nr:MAG: hypothetical protein A2647_02010 [Candidatus Nomurabacteria bacterium RIFCSPHIGHO2_01_FULL_40_24b]OGI90685.1 MAG: hypothetical protein A3A95_02255 [Candidatus Nomurabacteria bacterium RIFCSPLOWO2_01_FULL_39_18]